MLDSLEKNPNSPIEVLEPKVGDKKVAGAMTVIDNLPFSFDVKTNFKDELTKPYNPDRINVVLEQVGAKLAKDRKEKVHSAEALVKKEAGQEGVKEVEEASKEFVGAAQKEDEGFIRKVDAIINTETTGAINLEKAEGEPGATGASEKAVSLEQEAQDVLRYMPELLAKNRILQTEFGQSFETWKKVLEKDPKDPKALDNISFLGSQALKKSESLKVENRQEAAVAVPPQSAEKESSANQERLKESALLKDALFDDLKELALAENVTPNQRNVLTNALHGLEEAWGKEEQRASANTLERLKSIRKDLMEVNLPLVHAAGIEGEDPGSGSKSKLEASEKSPLTPELQEIEQNLKLYKEWLSVDLMVWNGKDPEQLMKDVEVIADIPGLSDIERRQRLKDAGLTDIATMTALDMMRAKDALEGKTKETSEKSSWASPEKIKVIEQLESPRKDYVVKYNSLLESQAYKVPGLIGILRKLEIEVDRAKTPAQKKALINEVGIKNQIDALDDLFLARQKYFDTRTMCREQLEAAQKEELSSKLKGEDLNKALDDYRRSELFDLLVLEEGQKLVSAKIKALPLEKQSAFEKFKNIALLPLDYSVGAIKKGISWYQEADPKTQQRVRLAFLGILSSYKFWQWYSLGPLQILAKLGDNYLIGLGTDNLGERLKENQDAGREKKRDKELALLRSKLAADPTSENIALVQDELVKFDKRLELEKSLSTGLRITAMGLVAFFVGKEVSLLEDTLFNPERLADFLDKTGALNGPKVGVSAYAARRMAETGHQFPSGRSKLMDSVVTTGSTLGATNEQINPATEQSPRRVGEPLAPTHATPSKLGNILAGGSAIEGLALVRPGLIKVLEELSVLEEEGVLDLVDIPLGDFCKKVPYVPDDKIGSSWSLVQKFKSLSGISKTLTLTPRHAILRNLLEPYKEEILNSDLGTKNLSEFAKDILQNAESSVSN